MDFRTLITKLVQHSRYFWLCLLAICFIENSARSETCFGLVSGSLVVDVSQCKKIDPPSFFKSIASGENSWINDLDKVGKKQLYESYEGLIVGGFVVGSKAIRADEIEKKSGALEGEQIQIFFPKGKNPCGNLVGHRISVVIKQKCCSSGGSVSPCLLDTDYVASRFMDGGKIPPQSPTLQPPKNRKEPTSEMQASGDKLFNEKKYEKAALVYSRAFKDGKLNTDGHYHFGFALRQLDKCEMAVKPLSMLYTRFVNSSFWPQSENTVRKGTLLLARCYAKLRRPAAATLILSGFLNQPEKYESEIKEALVNKDFGWIKSSKEYEDFKENAFKIINQKPMTSH